MFYSILAVLFLIKEFKILLSKPGFQKLNKIFNSQVRFFGYIIIFRRMKMLAQIADLRLCALMSLRPYFCALMSFALLSAPLCRVSTSYRSTYTTRGPRPPQLKFNNFLNKRFPELFLKYFARKNWRGGGKSLLKNGTKDDYAAGPLTLWGLLQHLPVKYSISED